MSTKDEEIARLRRRVAELERSQDAQLASILRAAPDSVMLLDLDANIQFINHTAPDLTNDQVIGTPVYAYLPPDAKPKVRACFERVLTTGQPDRYDTAYYGQDGSVSFWESRVGPAVRDGEIVGFVVLAGDITERRGAAADRDRLFEVSLDMLGICDLEGRIKRINPAFERVLGYEAGELLGRPVDEFIHEEDTARVRDDLGQLAAGEKIIDAVSRFRTKSGEYRHISWHATPDTEAGLVYAAGRDVTDRMALEAQLHQSQKMDAVGQLAGGIAHDFNNLLLVVMGNTAVLDAASHDPTQVQKRVEEIQTACSRAGDLTRQLLTFSRRQPLKTKLLDINEVVGGGMKMLQRLLPETIRVEYAPGEGLPLVDADRGQLEQVLMNLCVNARDAMPDGGTLSVATSLVQVAEATASSHPLGRGGDHVLLRVRDTGVGMSDAVREHVFEPFFTTKQPGQGTGLGLATAYGIVERHDGRVRVQSQPGEGSVFDVYLPRAERAAGTGGRRSQRAPKGGRETVLVAEDQEQVRSIVVQLLQRVGYTVLEAADGEEVLRVFEENRDAIDLLLFDVVMPRLSGPDAYQRIAEQYGAVPVIFTSGYTDLDHGGSSLPDEATILYKPYKNDDLLREVREALERRREAALSTA